MSAALPGLPKGEVFLTPPHPDWPALFAAEAARIRSALGARVLGLEHYGSTSIPGIKAKPVIDLLVGVARLEEADTFSPTMVALGYEDAGDGGVPGHRIFGLGAARTHICHVVPHEGPEWRTCLAFRDALRADRALALAYEALKVELAARHTKDRAAYTDGKTAFVQAVTATARSRG
ncbi:MAG: GrpB family protein [Phenylobacterium sp.]|uniref:GrpB family protein n=1 Tax=Phenylobacterium sp. TaxID=1871053 RepID=UPI00391D2A81